MKSFHEIMDNEEFLAKLTEVNTPEAMQRLFNEYSIALENGISIEEAFATVKSGEKESELGEAQLDELTGGAFISTSVALGACGALVLGVSGLAFLGGYAYQKVRRYFKK